MVSSVRWGSAKSDEFPVPLGIKQGGINSPDFFSCYIDGLIQMVRSLCIGCHISKLCVSVLLFADDICLIAPTRSALQRMIDACSSYCTKYGLTFNCKKSKILVLNGTHVDLDALEPLRLNGTDIEFVSQIIYLGMTIVSNPTFSFTAEPDLRSFYRASNLVLNVLAKPDEAVQMQLLFTNCVPTLSYGCSIKDYSSRQMSDCNIAVNNAIRRIFSFNKWESTRTLREQFGYPSLYEIFSKAKDKFRLSIANHSNAVLSSLSLINITNQDEDELP